MANVIDFAAARDRRDTARKTGVPASELVPVQVEVAEPEPGKCNNIEGDAYRATKGLDTTAIAKLVRKDIKALVKAKELPKMKISVRTSKYAGGSSISVTVKDAPFAVRHKETEPHGPRPYTDVAKVVLDKLDAVLDRYNFDNGEPMADYYHVRFYTHVTFASSSR